MKTKFIFALLLVLLAFSAGCGTVSETSIQSKLDQVVSEKMAEYGIPAVIVGIWVPGKLSYTSAIGKANLSTGRAAVITDKFRVACLTKTFTSTVILQLVDEGKIKLSDTLDNFNLGVSVPSAESITIRMLLNHTSGVFNFTDDANFWTAFAADPLKAWTSKELVELAITHPANFAPGTQYKYNNTDYELLKMIIENITGNKAEDEITSRIINRFSLSNTTYPYTSDPKMPNPHLNGYTPPNWSDKRGTTELSVLEDITEYAPFAEGMISNLDDLKVWAKEFALGTLLSAETQANRLTDLVPANDPQAGLGFLYAAGFIGRSGELPGYNSAMYYEPNSGITVVAAISRYPCKEEGAVDVVWIALIKKLKDEGVIPPGMLPSSIDSR